MDIQCQLFGAFDHIENKHSLYCRKDFLKTFCEFLIEHAKNLIDFEKKKKMLFTEKELKSHQDATDCNGCRKT